MKLFEVKDDIVTINIDTNFLRMYNKSSSIRVSNEEYNEYLIQKIKNGNQDAIIKGINSIKIKLLKSGCNSYEEFNKKRLKEEKQ